MAVTDWLTLASLLIPGGIALVSGASLVWTQHRLRQRREREARQSERYFRVTLRDGDGDYRVRTIRMELDSFEDVEAFLDEVGPIDRVERVEVVPRPLTVRPASEHHDLTPVG